MTDWQEVVGEHSSLVWTTAYRILNDRADADDCVQDTFLAALQLARRQPIENWSALLSRLSTRRALDRLRSRIRVAARCDAQIDFSHLASRCATPEQEARANELADRLRDSLTRLSSQQAEVVCLRCISELSYQEIAVQLGIDTAAVGRLLHRARAALRDLLAPVTPHKHREAK